MVYKSKSETNGLKAIRDEDKLIYLLRRKTRSFTDGI
jgi:hypothetical protein